MAEWCRMKNISAKGHPLVWHEVFPKWADAMNDDDVLKRLENRVRTLVAEYKGLINIWDVVNEATVSHNFDNAVGRWIKKNGAAKCVAESLNWARAGNPSATLLYNDFNVGPEFETLVKTLLELGAPVNAIGIQSHMHKQLWPLEKAWTVCETYARFGLPLHFTELTILSGSLKGPDDNDWHKQHDDWHSTHEGELAQAEYGEKLYTILFSHPAVEAITWWDFSDLRSWQGAPAGLVRKDMSPKPLYGKLEELFRIRWTTDVNLTTDEMGAVEANCFFGSYEITADTSSGEHLKGSFNHLPGTPVFRPVDMR